MAVARTAARMAPASLARDSKIHPDNGHLEHGLFSEAKPIELRSSSGYRHRARLHAGVEQQNAAHFLDRVGIALRRMAGLHDEFGLDRFDVSGGILDHAIIPLLDRPITLD